MNFGGAGQKDTWASNGLAHQIPKAVVIFVKPPAVEQPIDSKPARQAVGAVSKR
jgi:hypothetical protein